MEVDSREKLKLRILIHELKDHTVTAVSLVKMCFVEPETRGNHVYENIEYNTFRLHQNSGRSLEPSSAHRRPTDNRTHDSTPRPRLNNADP